MPSLRSLARVVLIPALLAGCSQSLFDARTDDHGGNDGQRDGAPEPMDIDGSPGGRDGGMVFIPDGGGNIPDAGGGAPPDGSIGRDICPAPCIGDAFDEIVDNVTATDGHWRFVEVLPATANPEYDRMSLVNDGNGFLTLQGTGDPAPRIRRCFSGSVQPPCTNLGDAIALTTTNLEAHHPAVQWITPMDGRYFLTASWRVAPESPVAETTMVLARNTQSVILGEQPLTLTPGSFEISLCPRRSSARASRSRRSRPTSSSSPPYRPRTPPTTRCSCPTTWT